jgi:hypothetical protein
LRKDYSPNSDIWCLRRDWEAIKHCLLSELNDGIYQFSPLDRYEFDDAIISLWSSQDMIALKLISSALAIEMSDHIPKSCYHTRGHGGLKQAVSQTHQAVSEQRYVMRGDIKGYYDSIRFDVLIGIIESYIQHPILLTLIHKALHRTETRGGNFYDYHDKGIPKESPLSPLLGAIALIPLDKAIGQIQGAFYARFMDDWVVLTKSKTALRKVIKITHTVLNGLRLMLHPSKTYIGKISHGFNFLGYYMDDQKILPSTETIRRFHERSSALYEPLQGNRKVSHRYKRNLHGRDISEYQVNEPAPTEEYFQNILHNLLALATHKPDTLAILRRYVGRWARWLKSGLSTITAFEVSVQTLLPGISSCWIPGAKVFTLGSCL